MRNTRENGITLIALIITIIVMLILVGVTVNVALNGGLFDTTKKAAIETRAAEVDEKATEWKALRETDKYSGTTNAKPLEELLNELESQKLLTAEEKEEVLATGQVTIGSRIIVFIDSAQSNDLDLVERYFLGANKEGKDIDKLLVKNSSSSDPIMFENDPDTITDARHSLKFIDEGNGESDDVYYCDVRYKGSIYRVTFKFEEIENENGETNEYGITKKVELIYDFSGKDELELLKQYFVGKGLLDVIDTAASEIIFKDNPDVDIYVKSISPLKITEIMCIEYNDKIFEISGDSVFENVELMYEPHGIEGKKVKYDGNNDGTQEDWMVLYDNGDNVEIVSMNVMGSVSLGDEDEQAQGDTDMDKAIYSYNNAITKLNNYCESLITNPNKISVRSVGSNPNDPTSENDEPYTSKILEDYDNGAGNWNNGKCNGRAKSADINYKSDYVRLLYHNSDNVRKDYWLASRFIMGDTNGDGEYFHIRAVKSDGNVQWTTFRSLFQVVTSSYGTGWSNYIYGVRPVVKVSKDLVK